MYTVLFEFTWRPMPPAACSRLCSKAWAGIFVRSAWSFEKSASIVVSAEYRLLLELFSIKTFSFIRSIEVRSAKSRQFINKYGANVSPCRTPVIKSKTSVSPLVEQTIAFVFLQSIIIAVIVYLGRPHVSHIWFILLLWIGSNAVEKSTNNSAASRFFARIPSTIQLIVRIYEIAKIVILLTLSVSNIIIVGYLLKANIYEDH